MSMKLKKSKGFAMAELLAVCVVVMLIFSILFANYLPLLAEYEVRISYNNVTSQYAAHYVRAIYKDVIEKDESFFQSALDANKGLYVIYNKDEDLENFVDDKEVELKKIVAQYGIEEIVLSDYKTASLKNNYSDVVKNGKMKNYINYLPEYQHSIYTGDDADANKQLYRITIRTKEFGYATTPVLTDQITASKCFILQYSSTGINPSSSKSEDKEPYYKITGYKYDGDVCGSEVNIDSEPVSNGSNKKAYIRAIGKEAFTPKKLEDNKKLGVQTVNVTSVHIPERVSVIENSAFEGLKTLTSYRIDSSSVKIGDKAFSNTGITGFNVVSNSEVHGITEIGAEAFSNNSSLKDVNILEGIKKIGDSAFTNNESLSSLTLIGDEKLTYGASVFSNCSTKTDNGLKVSIPNNLRGEVGKVTEAASSKIEDNVIPTRMFELTKIKSLEIGDSIKTIGPYAFNQYKSGSTSNAKTPLQSLSIPSSVSLIGQAAFYDLPIGKIEFVSGEGDLVIDNNSFQMKKNTNSSLSIVIPERVNSIGKFAFSGRNIYDLIFEESTSYIDIYQGAFSNNNIGEDFKMPMYVNFIYEYSSDNLVNAVGSFQQNSDLMIEKWPAEMYYVFHELGENDSILNEVKTLGVIPRKMFYRTYGTSSSPNTVEKKVIIPNYITRIDNSAFADTGITSLSFACKDSGSSSNLSIGAKAFAPGSNASKLEYIKLPSGITTVEAEAFLFAPLKNGLDYYSNALDNADWCKILTKAGECERTTTGIRFLDSQNITNTRDITKRLSGEGCVVRE